MASTLDGHLDVSLRDDMSQQLWAHSAHDGAGISEAVWLVVALIVLGVLLSRSRRGGEQQAPDGDPRDPRGSDDPSDKDADRS